MTGAYIVGIAVLLALGFGLYRRAVDGSFRAARAAAAPAPARRIGQELGATATLLQFSSAACSPCRATSRVLAEVESAAEGVAHIEIDAEHRLDLVGELGITRTPTVLLLDANGVEQGRILGAPSKADVLAALDGLGRTGAGAGARPLKRQEGGLR